MSSVGETLRRERLQKGLSLDQISRETKISTRFLDAIEKDQLDRLPGGVFAKSFVRQYARFLGLDEVELATEVEKVINPVAELPAFAAGPPAPVFKLPRVTEWESTGSRSNSSVLPALALVVAVMLVCSAVYAWWLRGRKPAPVQPPAAAHRVETPAVPKPAEPAPVTPAVSSNPAAPPKTEVAQSPAVSGEAGAAPGSAPVAAKPSAPVESSAAPNPAATLHVSLTASEDTWVQVWADGKSLIVRVLHANDARTVEALDSVRILTGNAGGLDLAVNGKPAGPIGPRGQVRTVEITSAGVQILVPPPKPAPAPEPL